MAKDPKDERPEVYGIVKEGSGFKLTRRGAWSVLGAAAVATVVGVGVGCATMKRKRRVRQMGLKSWTQPCGTPIPKDAVCVCNCIATDKATFRSNTEQVCICDTIEVPAGQAVAGSICTCDTVCTCNTIGGMSGGGGGGGYGGHYWHPN